MHSSLRLNQISKTFNKTVVLNQVNLDVTQGEIIGLLGNSGSGKTTLLRIIAGLEPSEGGSVYFHETCWQDNSQFVPTEKRHIGIVFQNYSLFPHLTVSQNILFGVPHLKNELNHMLNQLELENHGAKYPHQLSGGQQQRVAIARSIIRKPNLLLMDEPFSSLDENLKISLRKLIRKRLKENNITAILVTHDVNDAQTMCDRIALLNNGKLEQIDTVQKLYTQPKNLHCASMLGNVNTIQKDEKSLYFRNEDVAISTTGEWVGKLVSCTFIGERFLIEISREDNKIFAYHHEKMAENIEITFTITKYIQVNE